jgi:hypothetical protein
LKHGKKTVATLKSNLEKNTALKQILLAETPWVLQSANESDQQKRIAQLFDAAKLSTESNDLIEQLNQLQLEDGSFLGSRVEIPMNLLPIPF